MAITVDDFLEIHPELFHMAEPGTWESIVTDGLLSTSALLDRFGITGQQRELIEEKNRRESVTISHPSLGTAVIRDQIPMSDGALTKCLHGMTLREWYRSLNSRVFMWTTEERLMRLFNARAYRGKTQCILKIDTQAFLQRYADSVELSPLNSGSTIFNPQPRGADTFLSMADFPFDEWAKKRSRGTAVVEVTVPYSIPDISDFVTSVTHVKDKEIVERIL